MILVILLLFIAFTAKAVMDTIAHKFGSSIIFHNLPAKAMRWWHPTYSWRNKYKGGQPELGPKFYGADTFLVGLTDGWHLMQTIFLFCFMLGLLLYDGSLIVGMLLVALGKVWFEACYRYLLMRSFWLDIPEQLNKLWALTKLWVMSKVKL